jgi:hypothetical protein
LPNPNIKSHSVAGQLKRRQEGGEGKDMDYDIDGLLGRGEFQDHFKFDGVAFSRGGFGQFRVGGVILY